MAPGQTSIAIATANALITFFIGISPRRVAQLYYRFVTASATLSVRDERTFGP